MSESEIPSHEESHSFSINIGELSDDEVNRIKSDRLREVMKEMKKYSASPADRKRREPYVKITFVKAVPPHP